MVIIRTCRLHESDHASDSSARFFLCSSKASFPSLSSLKRYIGKSSRTVLLNHSGRGLYNLGGMGMTIDVRERYSL